MISHSKWVARRRPRPQDSHFWRSRTSGCTRTLKSQSVRVHPGIPSLQWKLTVRRGPPQKKESDSACCSRCILYISISPTGTICQIKKTNIIYTFSFVSSFVAFTRCVSVYFMSSILLTTHRLFENSWTIASFPTCRRRSHVLASPEKDSRGTPHRRHRTTPRLSRGHYQRKLGSNLPSYG